MGHGAPWGPGPRPAGGLGPRVRDQGTTAPGPLAQPPERGPFAMGRSPLKGQLGEIGIVVPSEQTMDFLDFRFSCPVAFQTV